MFNKKYPVNANYFGYYIRLLKLKLNHYKIIGLLSWNLEFLISSKFLDSVITVSKIKVYE